MIEKKSFRQLIAITLVFAMVFSLLPSKSSYAAELDETVAEETEDTSVETTESEETTESTTEVVTEEMTEDTTEQTTETVTEVSTEASTEESVEEITTEAENDFEEETTETVETETEEESEESEETVEVIPTFDHLYDGVSVAGKDFSSCELLIGTSDSSIFTQDTEVVSEFNGIYLTRYADEEQTKAAYTYYYTRADIVEVNGNIKANDEDYVEEPTEEAPTEDTEATENEDTEEVTNDGHGEADLSSLNTGDDAFSNMSNTSVGNYSGAIALIDTGASGSNVIGSVSVLGDSGADDNGHGSTLAAAISEANPNARILSIKSLNSGAIGSVSDVYSAIEYAIQSNVAVINLSVCSIDSADSQLLRNAIAEAIASGITVVVSAGNNSSDAGYYTPANISSVFTIGACDTEGNRISKSNYGSVIDYYVVADSTSVAAAKFSAYIVNGLDFATSKEDVFTREYVESEKETVDEEKEEGEEKPLEEPINTVDIEENYTLPTNRDEDGNELPSSTEIGMVTPSPNDLAENLLLIGQYDENSSWATVINENYGYGVTKVTKPSWAPDSISASGLTIQVGADRTNYQGAIYSFGTLTYNGGTAGKEGTILYAADNPGAYLTSCYDHHMTPRIDRPVPPAGNHTINITLEYAGVDSSGYVYYANVYSGYAPTYQREFIYICIQRRPWYYIVGVSKIDSNSSTTFVPGCTLEVYTSKNGTKLGDMTESPANSGKYVWKSGATFNDYGSTVAIKEVRGGGNYNNSLNNNRWKEGVTLHWSYTEPSSPTSYDTWPQFVTTSLNIIKSSSNTTCTTGNPNYDLNGTKFAIYKKRTGEYCGEIEINSSGQTKAKLNLSGKMDKNSAGTSYIDTYFEWQEIAVGKNYQSNGSARHEFLIAGNNGATKELNISNTPVMDPVNIVIAKQDKSGATTSDLSNAQFTVKFYALDASATTTYTAAQLATQTPAKTWVIKTIKNSSGVYEAVLDPAHKISGDSYYSNGELPLGWMTIEETTAPAGYVKDDNVSVIKIDRPHADIGTINVINSPIMSADGSGLLEETPVRADFEFTKHKYDTGETMEGVKFIIRNTGTLEEYTVTTDANGHYSSADLPHSDPNGLWFELNKDMGVVPVDDNLGALPYGHYQLEEIRCEANKGYQLEPIREFDVTEADHGKVITVFDGNATASDSKIHDVPDAYLQTQAFCIETQSHTLACGLETPQTIEDKVWYWYLGSAEDFTLVGKLMVKEADGSFTPYKKINVDASGNITYTDEDLIKYMNFTTEAAYQKSYYEQSGEKIMTFDNVMPLKKDEGKAYVVFEYLYKGTWDESNIDQAGEPYLKHEEDIYEQTIYVPKGETEAYNVVNLSKTAYPKVVKLSDIVKYEGLTIGKEYELKTQIYVKEDKNVKGITYDKRAELEGNLLKDANGKTIEVSSKFKPTSPSGTTEISIEVDLSKYFDKSFVFLEDVYDQGILIFSHADINAPPQTIHSPTMKTRAFGEGDLKIAYAKDPTTTFTDKIDYTNLEENTTYTAVGYILDAKTGKEVMVDGKRIQATKTFTTPAANRENGGVDGTVDVEFSVDNAKKVLEGIDIVIFEELYVGTTVTSSNLVAEHKDLTDKEQKLKFIKLGTLAKDGEDTDDEKLLKPDGSYKLIDTCSYSNIEINKEYKLDGIIIRKDTGEPLKDKNGNDIIASTTFTPTTESGSVDVVFEFETDVTGLDIVVFEELSIKTGLKDWTPVEEHKDKDDEGQTVKIGSKGRLGLDKNGNGKDRGGKIPTGDSIPVIPVVAVMLSALAGAVVIIRKKRKS